MKKLLTTSLLLFSLLVLAHSNVFAQQQTPTKLGIGVIYGDEPGAAGLKVDATFRVAPDIALAPDVSVYFPDDNEAPFYDSYWAVNLNGHYIFSADTDYHLYGIGGLNITKVDYKPGGDDTKLGINLGIGGEYHLENFSLYGELKYIVSDLDQVVLGVGARFPLN